MKTVLIRNKMYTLIIFILLGTISINAQKIEIWNEHLNAKIILHQKVSNDSVYLTIDKKENLWLGKNVDLKTINYWINAPIEVTANCSKKNTLTITRAFLGNNIIGDKIYFKKYKKKYYFNSIKEFEQKCQ